MKKFGNVFSIVVAWVLSIVLVIMLTVTPLALSALSLLNAHVITDVVIEVVIDLMHQQQDKAAGYQINKLTSVTLPAGVTIPADATIPEDVTIPQDVLNQLPEDTQQNVQETVKQNGGVAAILEKYLGTPVTAEQVERVMSSNTVKEVLTVYTGDLTRVLTGEEKLSEMDSQKIQSIVNKNMDEVIEIVQELKPDVAKKDVEALKQEISKVVEEKAEEIIQALPKPEEIKQQIVETAPEIGIALKILEKKKVIEMGLIGTVAGLCALIFLCRLENFRGFRWLAVDMFVGGGINALLSLVLLIETPVIAAMIPNSSLTTIIEKVLHAFDLALFERAAIILVAGGVLLTAYILINKAKAKKAVANVEE